MFGRKKTIAAAQDDDNQMFPDTDGHFAEHRKMPPLDIKTAEDGKQSFSLSDILNMPQAIKDHFQGFRLKSKGDELVNA